MARTTTTRTRSRAKPSPRSRSQRPSKRPTVDRGLQAFLERLSSAMTAGDGEAAAACFEYPAFMVMQHAEKYGPSQVMADEGAAAAMFARAPQMYRARGIEETFPDVEDVQDLGGGLLLVRTRFPYIGPDGNDLGDGETSLYVVRRSGEDYAICAAVALGTDSDAAGSAA